MSEAVEVETDIEGSHLFEEWQDFNHDFDMEVTEMMSHDHMDVDEFDLEHSELEHVHMHHEDNTDLVHKHFPHLVPPQENVDHDPVLMWLGSFFLVAIVIIACYESLRWFINARHASSNSKKKKSKEKENNQAIKSGPMPLSEALRVLCQTSQELKDLSNSAHSAENPFTVQQYAEAHYSSLSRLAFSLYEHVHKNFHQFEAVSSDTSWLLHGSEVNSNMSSGGSGSGNGTSNGSNGSGFDSSVDVISEISVRVDTIMGALTTTNTTHTTTNTIPTTLHARKRNTTHTTHTTHIEDRLNSLYTQWGLSDIRVQYSLVHDALLKVQCMSSKGYVSEIMSRLSRAVEMRNEYHLLDTTTLLQELDQHALLCSPAYTAAVEALSEIHDAEDRKVRRDAQEQLLLDQNEMMDTFQTFSTPREQGSAKKPPLTLTNNRYRTFSAPIVAQNSDIGTPSVAENATFGVHVSVGDLVSGSNEVCNVGVSAVENTVAEVCRGVENMSVTGGTAGAGVVVAGDGMDMDAINTSTTSVPSAPPLTLDSDCLSAVNSTKYYNTVTSPTADTTYTTYTNANNNSTLTTTTTTTSTTPNDTTLLISSQWAMEALKLRREAQNNVEHKLHRLREKRADNEARARGRARSSIEERGKEVRGAKLFLEGLDEQRKTRQAAETEAFTLQEKELLHEFALHKQAQQVLDRRVYTVVCVVYIVVYLLVYSGYTMNSGLVGLYGWMLNTMRSSCDFLACEKKVTRAIQLYNVHSNSGTVSSADRGTISSIDDTQLLLPDTPHYTDYAHSVYRQPSLQVVTAYQTSYRTATHYLDSLFTPVSSYALKYALGGYIGSTPTAVYASNNPSTSSGGGGSVWYEVYKGGKCMFHVLLRTLPATALSKLLAFIGWKKISGWVAVFLTFLCFSDILVQMAVGPLLPLLTILCLHTLLYSVVAVLFEHKLRWVVRGRDIRYLILYVLYPLVGFYVVYSVAQRK